MRKLLVVGSQRDPHITAVLKDSLLAKAIFLNRYDLPSISLNYQTENVLFDEETIPFSQPLAIWWRQKVHFLKIPPVNSKDMENLDRKNFFITTWNTFNNSMPGIFVDCIDTNPIASRRSANSKPTQLLNARLCGFRVPKSLITNSVEEIRQSFEDKVIIKKAADVQLKEALNPYAVVLPIKKLLALKSEIELVPIIVQEYIDKSYELRVNVIDGECFATRINSQNSDDTKIDWRTSQHLQTMFETYEIEGELRKKLLAFMQMTGLNFGAFDLIRTPEGEIVFLECNPDGQWLFLNKETSNNTTNAMHTHIQNLIRS